MAVTMQHRGLLIPTGFLGVVVGIALYLRERRRYGALAFQGSLDRDRSRP
jgi:hypothetical protein